MKASSLNHNLFNCPDLSLLIACGAVPQTKLEALRVLASAFLLNSPKVARRRKVYRLLGSGEIQAVSLLSFRFRGAQEFLSARFILGTSTIMVWAYPVHRSSSRQTRLGRLFEKLVLPIH